MSKPLTAAGCQKLRPAKDRREIPDGACPGLFLIVQPSGAKSWALRFRRPDGRPAKLVLGSASLVGGKELDAPPALGGHHTLAAARRLVTELRHEIAQGRDPAAVYQKEKEDRRLGAVDAAANTFAVAAVEFVEQHSRRKVRRWKEQARLLGVKPDDLTIIPKGLADRWRERPVATIDGHDVHSVIDEVRRFGIPGLVARVEGASESRARKMFGVLSKLFAWLLRQRRVVANPCVGVARPEAPKARDRVLNNAEIAKLWRAADAETQPIGAVVKLLLLTGCRLAEVSGMRRDELSEDGTVWTIPGTRTKNHRPHVVPLPPLARDIIAGMRRIEGSAYVFTIGGGAPIGGWSATKLRLDAAMGNPPRWVLHDLRRTAATGMAEIGIQPHIVEAVLNHISGAKAGVAGIYNRAAYAPEKKAALERWARHVAGLVAGKVANVVALHG